MSCKSLVGLILVFICSGSPAGALSLSYEECASFAAQNNADIAVALEGVKSNEALVLGAWSGFVPQVSASAGYTENGSAGGTATTLGNGTTSVVSSGSSSTKQFSGSLQATQNLFNGFTDVGKVQQARANLEAARANLALVKATVSMNLKTAFAELLFEQRSVDLTAAILKRQQNNLRMVTLRYEGGNENRGNQLYQAASVSQAEYQYQHAKRQIRNGARQLAALLGRPEQVDLEVRGELSATLPDRTPDYDKIATEHPTHKQNLALKNAAEAGIAVIEGNWYPNLNLVGSVGKVGPTYPPESDRWSVGVALSYPLFPGTTTIAGVINAKALNRQAEAALLSADYKVIAALEAAYAALADSLGQVKVADDFNQGAKARSVIADGKYNTGLMTFEDWSVIDSDYTTRQQTLLTNKRNAMQAEAAWENAEGVGAIK